MLNERDYRDRHIRAAIEEEADLLKSRIIIRKLDEPIQCGWRRYFALTEHAQRRRDCETLSAILQVIGSERICRRFDFRARRRFGRRRPVEIEQSISRLFDHTWEALQCPVKWRRYFYWFHYKEWGRSRYFGEFAQPSLFELRIEPYLAWEVRAVDPAVETRLHEIATWLDTHGRRQRYAWLMGQSQGRRWKPVPTEREKILQRKHEREIFRAYRDFPDVDPGAPVWHIRISVWTDSFSHPFPFFPGSEVWVPSAIVGSTPAASNLRGRNLRPVFSGKYFDSPITLR